MAGDFRFSYLLIKYRKVSGSDDTRNAVVRKLAQGFESLSLRQSKPKSNTKVFGLGFSFAKIQVLLVFFGCRHAVVSVFSGFV